MKNLAGNPLANAHCERELRQARIEIVMLDEMPRSEVPSKVTGKLGDITLTRAWYYWVANGPVPLAIAEKLYSDPIGARDVRVAGHCGCPPPAEWATYHDDNGPVEIDPTGDDENQYDQLVAKGSLSAEDKPRFVKSTAGLRAFVECYHIDSPEGLRLFADTLRGVL